MGVKNSWLISVVPLALGLGLGVGVWLGATFLPPPLPEDSEPLQAHTIRITVDPSLPFPAQASSNNEEGWGEAVFTFRSPQEAKAARDEAMGVLFAKVQKAYLQSAE